MDASTLPRFPYHRDPIASGCIVDSDVACECCGRGRGVLYQGNIYGPTDVEALCPWCIADGSAADKFLVSFFDGDFCDDDFNRIELPEHFHRAVFERTIGFSTFNSVSWWVHCGEPAEFIYREEPYDMVFECRKCGLRHTVPDFD